MRAPVAGIFCRANIGYKIYLKKLKRCCDRLSVSRVMRWYRVAEKTSGLLPVGAGAEDYSNDYNLLTYNNLQ
jgi:hypothetical protein